MKFWITIKDGLGKTMYGPEMGEYMEYEYAEDAAQDLMAKHGGTSYDVTDEPPVAEDDD